MFDVDPEVVRKGVRSLMQQVAQIERERVPILLSLIAIYHSFLINFTIYTCSNFRMIIKLNYVT